MYGFSHGPNDNLHFVYEYMYCIYKKRYTRTHTIVTRFKQMENTLAHPHCITYSIQLRTLDIICYIHCIHICVTIIRFDRTLSLSHSLFFHSPFNFYSFFLIRAPTKPNIHIHRFLCASSFCYYFFSHFYSFSNFDIKFRALNATPK